MTHSKSASNCAEILALITQPNSKPFYDAVLTFLTDEYQSVSSFTQSAIIALNQIPSQVSVDCYADVIRILDGLVQAGLAKSRMTTIVQGEFETVIGSRVDYALT
ncbi:hypothetical protein GCM10009347_26610 [Shewanella algicola]|uniref:Uncharacterized protein n=1 Tax=Shewanella algicola TaxID=640633 RepID=A0A9X1Z629_9GAMM|nr:hypothetical protein [Shewanella algicola]MCL1106365.1 hypothetical protein [Shewanella algicola]GGP58889.1 hypothetical protein GCM10009347_26610 [Shewanella algicola]